MKKVKDQIVYLSETPDEWPLIKGIISRIALHPMIIKFDNLEDLNNTNYKKEIFPFRIAFKVNNGWRYSCLGINNESFDEDYYDPGTIIRGGTIDSALKWLLKGEKDMKKLL